MKTQKKIIFFAALAALIVAISCKKPSPAATSETTQDWPVLPSTPDNYRVSSNDNAAALGRVLFYDKNLSLNNSVSCSSCHQQSKAFCDNKQFSTGLMDGQTPRNSPSLFAKTGRMFWDGRADGITDLVIRPIKNHVEMRFDNISSLSDKLSKIDYYPALFQKAFGTERIDSTRIQMALSEFLKNFDFSNNKFARSQNNLEALTATEEIGRLVFFGKGHCSNCHHIEAARNPIFPGDTIFENPGGGYGFTNESFNIGLDVVYKDKGLGAISGNSSQDGQFMVPALLNVEFTAPYMHDGRFKTLEEVVEHYNSGIKNNPNLDAELRDFSAFENMSEAELIKKFDLNHNGMIEDSEIPQVSPVRLGLTDAEKRGLVAFLKTLSDPAIFTDHKFSNPFAVK
jgi:cytochrome c peroxidase